MKLLRVFAWLFPSYLQMNVAAAVVGSAVVGGVAQSSAAKKAANSQAAAADAANQTQLEMYYQNREDQAPFRATGLAANNRLAYLLGLQGANSQEAGVNQLYQSIFDSANQDHINQYGIGIDQSDKTDAVRAWKDQMMLNARQQYSEQNPNVANDPAYGSLLRKFSQDDLNNDVVYNTGLQFGLDEGNKAINRQAAASGNMLSGATLKALTRYGNDYGSTKANDAYNRFNTDQSNIYNRLAGVSGAGQAATNQVGASGQNYANQVSNNQTALGNARGASAIAQGNAWGNAGAQIGNYYMQQNYLNQLNGGGSGGWYNNVYKQ